MVPLYGQSFRRSESDAIGSRSWSNLVWITIVIPGLYPLGLALFVLLSDNAGAGFNGDDRQIALTFSLPLIPLFAFWCYRLYWLAVVSSMEQHVTDLSMRTGCGNASCEFPTEH